MNERFGRRETHELGFENLLNPLPSPRQQYFEAWTTTGCPMRGAVWHGFIEPICNYSQMTTRIDVRTERPECKLDKPDGDLCAPRCPYD